MIVSSNTYIIVLIAIALLICAKPLYARFVKKQGNKYDAMYLLITKSIAIPTKMTTGEIIGSRIYQEARLLLQQTQWNVSEIAFILGFEEVAHFSNFFKKYGKQSPQHFRENVIV